MAVLDRIAWVVGVMACACGPTTATPSEDSSTGSTTMDSVGTLTSTASTTTASTGTTTVGPTTGTVTTDTTIGDTSTDDTGTTPDVGGGCDGCGRRDILMVVDNSGSMGDEQLAMARAMVAWVGQVQGGDADVQIMVTTTDMGNPLCTPFQPAGYEPADGAPTTTGCNARIDHFTGLGANPIVMPEACTDVCPADVVPADPFVAFGPRGTNVPDVPDADIDGDGSPDGAVAQAVGCLLPQGINGCGYESPLEAMLQALNPGADWNLGARPFVRDDADLAIVVITDESDCSVEDFTVMDDEDYFNTNPDNGTPQASSALCWNAGVTCDGPDAGGVYSDCQPTLDSPLREVARYTQYLRDELVDIQGKRVDFFAVTGVPDVTEYDDAVPYAPTAGGLLDLVYRNWQDGEYPAGDIGPDEWAQGVTAADKTFQFGIGPGCTGVGPGGVFTGQGLPNPRLFAVCQALDEPNAQRCFVDSVCDEDFSGLMNTLRGVLLDAGG